MNELLARIIDAQGGIERWTGYEKIDATIVSGGGLSAQGRCAGSKSAIRTRPRPNRNGRG